MPKEPFRTQNRQLAFALFLAGCTPAPDDQDGPAINIYTLGYLRQPKFRQLTSGKDIESAAKSLIHRKIPGIVTYCFVRNQIFEQTVEAWDAMAEEFQKADYEERQPSIPKIDHRTVAQVMFIAVNSQESFNKIAFMNEMRQLVSTVQGETKDIPIKDPKTGDNKPAPKHVTSGKGKVWTIGASKAIKEHLKV